MEVNGAPELLCFPHSSRRYVGGGLIVGSAASGSGQSATEQSRWDIQNQSEREQGNGKRGTERAGKRDGVEQRGRGNFSCPLSPCVPLDKVKTLIYHFQAL